MVLVCFAFLLLLMLFVCSFFWGVGDFLLILVLDCFVCGCVGVCTWVRARCVCVCVCVCVVVVVVIIIIVVFVVTAVNL